MADGGGELALHLRRLQGLVASCRHVLLCLFSVRDVEVDSDHPVGSAFTAGYELAPGGEPAHVTPE
jgi:hypothetical protein